MNDFTYYNYNYIPEPKILITNEFDNSISSCNINFIDFIEQQDWIYSNVGTPDGLNIFNKDVRKSMVCTKKVNLFFDNNLNNHIIQNFIGIKTPTDYQNNITYSNITWNDNNHNMRIFEIIKYQKNDFFSSHIDAKENSSHIGTIIIIPPKSMFNHQGGELILQTNEKEIIINADDTKWFCLVFDINIKHKLNKILSGQRIIFKSKIYFKQPKDLWFQNELNNNYNHTEINTIKQIRNFQDEYFNKYFNKINDLVLKDIQELEEELKYKKMILNQKLFPVVARLKCFIDKTTIDKIILNNIRIFIILKNNYAKKLSINYLLGEDCLLLNQIIKLYPNIKYKVLSVKYQINCDFLNNNKNPDFITSLDRKSVV